jgi:DNA-binding CsgD family transcriptional regulator/PAS domain-containing protein
VPSAEALSKLLLVLYAAPTQPELWEKFLRDFTQLLGGPATSTLHRNLAREEHGFGFAVGGDSLVQSWYASTEGNASYEGGARGRKRKPGAALVSALDMHHDPPEPAVLATIELILPHIRTALQLRHRLAETDVICRNYTDVLDSLRAGVVLLNDRGECIFVNREAQRLCAADDGIYIRESRLGAHRPDEHQLLSRLIARAAALGAGKTAPPGNAVSIHRRNAPPLKISAVALSSRSAVRKRSLTKIASLAVFIRNVDDGLTTLPDLLMTTFGLTSAEARLGAQLFEGCSLTQAAERNNVSRETVRVQLRSIFDKTHVRRQAELLRLISQLTRPV